LPDDCIIEAWDYELFTSALAISVVRSYWSFSKGLMRIKTMMKGVCITGQQCKAPDTVPETHCASTEGFNQLDPKMRIINVLFLRTISEIKLKRTDTTLDLSQKA
jgi:hypothetical protein